MEIDYSSADYWEEQSLFRHSLITETDRGCALMAAAYVDDQLKRLIEKCLISDSKHVNEMIGRSGPLGSFSSRITMAYLLGKISKETHRNLDLFRKIRNEFGHFAKPLSFDDEPIASWCRELKVSLLFPANSARDNFCSIASHSVGSIHQAIINIVQPEPFKQRDVTDEERAREKEFIKASALLLRDHLSEKITDGDYEDLLKKLIKDFFQQESGNDQP